MSICWDKQCKASFQANGILTLQDLQSDIQSKQQLAEMLKMGDKHKVNSIWAAFNANDEQINVTKQNDEGRMTEYR